jgi:HPr kinase/phosphorylase
MSRGITAAELFDAHAERLGLSWVAGLAGGDRQIDPEAAGAARNPSFIAWAGHLNPVHPCRVQIIGPAETAYLAELEPPARAVVLDRLFSAATACLIVSDDERIDEAFIAMADAGAIPLFRSDLAGYKIISHLQHYLSNVLAERVNLHGVFMEVLGIGVLLTGKSGVGKSELALELISRNHRLIADDAPEFRRIAPDELNGCCPSGLIGFLEVRGLGVLNIRAMFGDSVIKLSKNLRLIIELQRMSDRELAELDRLEGSRRYLTILDVEVPQITLPVVPGHNLAVLVEGAVRNHILLLKGYNASQAFIERQQQLILESDA